MRKRIYVLWRFSMDGFVIRKDIYTPLGQLTTLDHCYGVFETYWEAFNRAKEILDTEMCNIKIQIERMRQEGKGK